MRMSTRARYGLRMLIELARSSKETIPLRTIAHRLGVSKKYLERIAKTLEDSGIITATRGVKGGYRLRIDPEEIKIYDILSSLEGNLALSDCFLHHCRKESDCLANRFWLKLGQNIRSFLNRQSLADLLEVR